MNRSCLTLTRNIPFYVVIAFCASLSAVHAEDYIAGVTAQATSAQVFPASVLTNNNGLTETATNSGIFRLTTNAYADGGSFWNSGYVGFGADENPYVEFDLGASYTVDRFHVWNYNDPGYQFRGFRQVTIQASDNGTTWRSLSQRFVFAKAPGLETYTGEDYTFSTPVKARYLRFIADSTHRNFAGRELAGLGKVRFHAGGVAVPPPAPSGVFPADSGVINVKLPPYNAVGDGVADDTDAIQRAINDWQFSRQTILLPAGTYKVTRSLKLSNQGFGFTNLRGASASATTILLADNTFTDANNPQPVLSAANNRGPGGISADWFNNNFGYFTIAIGDGNPGAIGLQFYANNVGAVRNVNLIAGEGSGKIGLDLGYDDQNGPLLAKNISIEGFQVAINAGFTVNSQTLENITIDSPGTLGIQNGGQCLSIRRLNFIGTVPAIHNTGFMTLIDSNISYDTAGPVPVAAITNNEALFVRNVSVAGYATAVQNNYGGTPNAPGGTVTEYVSHPVLSQFANRPTSLRLPIKNTPEPPSESVATWANVRNFRKVTDPDDTAAVQRAIDSGATTIYFPSQGTYQLTAKVRVRGAVRRILGMFSTIIGTNGGGFQVDSGTTNTVWIDDLGSLSGALQVVNASARTLVGRNLQDPSFQLTGTGELFLENVATGPLSLTGQKVWGRQLNIEGRNTKVVNNGGTFWTLGFKSEDGGTLIATSNNGKSELIGGLYYSQTGNLAPMFTNDNASVSLSIAEVNYSSNPFLDIVQETRGTTTRVLSRTKTPQRRFLTGNMVPLYVGYNDPTYLAPPFNVQAVGGNQKITLTWDALAGTTSYIVRRATSPNGTYTTVGPNVLTNTFVNSGLPANATYYYIVAANYGRRRSAYSTPVSATTDAVAIYRINCGGGATGNFGGDQFANGGNVAGTGSTIDTTGVDRPAPQGVYQSERWGDCSYVLPGLTPGGTYKLRLHFAEFVVGGAGERVFNVNVNGSAALTNFDIIAATGGINRATVREVTATANASGQITVEFVSVVAAAKISGIEVLLP